MKRIGREIRRLRAASGLTQIELESRTGIDRSALSLFEHEYRSPTEAQVRLLIRVLSAAVKDRVKAVSKVAAHAEHLEVPACSEFTGKGRKKGECWDDAAKRNQAPQGRV